MASKLENMIYNAYKGGAEAADSSDDDETVSDASENVENLEGDADDVDSDVESGREGADDHSDGEDDDIDEDSDDDDEDDGEQGAAAAAATTKKAKAAASAVPSSEVSEDEDDEDDDEDYLQKLDDSVRHNIIGEHHPEMIQHNDEEVETLCKIVRDADGVIIDPFHKTLPFVTKYEKARILGERAKQINAGAKPFIAVEKHMIDGYLIALREFEEKKIPFIVRRPLPNGGSEYWKLADLQILD